MPIPPPEVAMWDLSKAISIYRVTYPFIFDAGYHSHLGGSVLYRGKSTNDLDIIIIRQAQVLETNIDAALKPFYALGFTLTEKIISIPFRYLYRLVCTRPGYFKGTAVDLIVFELTGAEPQQTRPHTFGNSGSGPSNDDEDFEEKRAAGIKKAQVAAKRKYDRLRTDIKNEAIKAAENICRNREHIKANPPNPDNEGLDWFGRISIAPPGELFGFDLDGKDQLDGIPF